MSDQDTLSETALQTIGAIAQLPIVRVDRDVFLRKQFKNSPHLATILSDGPPAVYSSASLRLKADSVIRNSSTKTAAVSFASGLPGNPLVMVAAGGADVAQYFGFALNLAQQIAYLFGEDELFDGEELSEAAQIRVIGYLGAMLGAAGASALVANMSKLAGENLGKKLAAQAIAKTTWYPLVKKVGAVVGREITKRTIEKTISKAVPVVGGVISAGFTYVTFRPMGRKLADVLQKNLDGHFNDQLDLNPEFASRLKAKYAE